VKAVILCGGMGTRLKEETEYKPKPMVEIGDKPILWHIMKLLEIKKMLKYIVTIPKKTGGLLWLIPVIKRLKAPG